ncbi:UNVERIFIED_ORG: hypothetical protein E4P37_16130 [Bacillus sp. AZ43]
MEPAGETGFPLPGGEALTPPPPDAAADEHREGLAALPDGMLAADLELSVSGLTAFAEPVTGSCASMASQPTVIATLSDGSTLRVGFAEEGGTLLLAAAGIESAHTLAGVDLDATSGGFRLAADLLTEGTSERSGRLVLDGTCR